MHISAGRNVGGYTINLRQVQFVDSTNLEPVFVNIDDNELPLSYAAHLAAELAAAVAEANLR